MLRIMTKAGCLVSKTAMACGWSEETGIYALAQISNAFAAEDAVCLEMEAEILFPLHTDRVKAYAMERRLRKVCCEQEIEWKGTKIRQGPLWEVPVILLSGIGEVSAGTKRKFGIGEVWADTKRESEIGAVSACMPDAKKGAGFAVGETDTKRDTARTEGRPAGRPGEEIILVKWIGLEGMLRIVDEKEDELRQRFAPVFIRQIQSYRNEIFAGKELEIAKNTGVSGIYQITEGGILAALWELAKETGLGLEVDMKRISVLQETIEVCEHYRLNPYQMTSAGSFLMLAENGKALTDALGENRIRASVIGRLAAGNDKALHNGGDIRYLDRQAPDELYKIFA